MNGYTKITKAEFYKMGGFSNPQLVRLSRSGVWVYYQK